MAFKMSPVGKKKCSYSPMQKKGLINSSPVHIDGNTVSSSGGKETVKVDRSAKQVGGNVNHMVRDGYQPKGEFVNDRGVRIVQYVPGSNVVNGKVKYYQFNNEVDSDGKLSRELDRKTYIDMLSKGQQIGGNRSKFKRLEDLSERDMSGSGNQQMTDQVTKGEMAGNFEEKV